MRRLVFGLGWILSFSLLIGSGCASKGHARPAPKKADPVVAVVPETGPLTELERHTGDVTAVSDLVPVEETGASICPVGALLVQGNYCTEVRHTCKHWLDDQKLQYARCGEYEKKAECVGKRIALRFCIDRDEYTKPGDDKPMNWSSFMTSSKVCKQRGMRICTESEWNFACEGEQMRPYPYGWSREAKCNQDREDLYIQTPKKQLLKDNRQAASDNPECLSPFGVHNMVGNVDEPVLREEARFNPPFRNALKGGWWMAGRNRCRPATTAHDDYYFDIQVGVRCCSDVPGESGAKG